MTEEVRDSISEMCFRHSCQSKPEWDQKQSANRRTSGEWVKILGHLEWEVGE